MPRRDYARPPQQSGLNKTLIIALIILCLSLAGVTLWLLKDRAEPLPTQAQTDAQKAHTPPKSSLPSRPEEVYSYIRDLETREIPVGADEKYAKEQAQLNAKQEQLLKEQKALEEKRLAEQQAAQNGGETAQAPVEAAVSTDVTQSADQELAAAKAKELAEKEKAKKLADEKRAAERKKQELAKQEQAQKEAKLKAQQAKAKEAAKAPETGKPVSKFGLQCGAFKNRGQAENMQARLAMAGYNARINANADWNRVVVGPIGDRAAASSAQANARTVADCVVVGM